MSTIVLRKIPYTRIFITLLVLLFLYAALVANADQIGYTGQILHEVFHDGRHFLGTPCH